MEITYLNIALSFFLKKKKTNQISSAAYSPERFCRHFKKVVQINVRSLQQSIGWQEQEAGLLL